jgi:cell division protein FtsB
LIVFLVIFEFTTVHGVENGWDACDLQKNKTVEKTRLERIRLIMMANAILRIADIYSHAPEFT